MRKGLSLTIASALFITGCLVGPNYQPPAQHVPPTWATEAEIELVPCASPLPTWWTLFQDPLLDTYIERAARYNYDVRAAEINIWQARSLCKIAAAELLPHVAGDLNGSRTYFSKNGPIFTLFPEGGDIVDEDDRSPFSLLPFQVQIPQLQTVYNALLDVSWEIDLFGKRRRKTEAAAAGVGSAMEEKNGILLSCIAEVALQYIQVRSYQKRGILLADSISLLEQTAQIMKVRVEAGLSDRLDLDRIEAEMIKEQAQLPDVRARLYQSIYALSMLLGILPECLLQELTPFAPLPSMPEQIAIGIRSDLVRRRPDIRQAERELAAATAHVGVAVASFFPTFTLLGDVGVQSIRLNNLFQAGSLTWAVGGDIHFPIFQGGKLRGNLQAMQAQAAIALCSYRQTVLTALREAEGALVALVEERRTMGYLQQATDKYKDLAGLTRERYTRGLVSLMDLLDVMREEIGSEQCLLTSQTAALADVVLLYKSLGGGWEPYQEECTPAG